MSQFPEKSRRIAPPYSIHLKVPPQFHFSLVSVKTYFTKNQTYLISFVHLLYVVFVKSSDKLLHYLMLGQTLTEVKI